MDSIVQKLSQKHAESSSYNVEHGPECEDDPPNDCSCGSKSPQTKS